MTISGRRWAIMESRRTLRLLDSVRPGHKAAVDTKYQIRCYAITKQKMCIDQCFETLKYQRKLRSGILYIF